MEDVDNRLSCLAILFEVSIRCLWLVRVEISNTFPSAVNASRLSVESTLLSSFGQSEELEDGESLDVDDESSPPSPDSLVLFLFFDLFAFSVSWFGCASFLWVVSSLEKAILALVQ